MTLCNYICDICHVNLPLASLILRTASAAIVEVSAFANAVIAIAVLKPRMIDLVYISFSLYITR